MNTAVAPSNCAVLHVIYQTVPLSTREDTVVANATTKKVNEQATKTFPKRYVGRNGKRNLQNYTYKCVDRSRHNGIKGAMIKCVC